MTRTPLHNGAIYRINANEIDYIGYFYGAHNGCEDLHSAHSRLTSERKAAPAFLTNCELFNIKTRAAASDVVSGGKIHRLTEGFGIAFPENKAALFTYKNGVNAADYAGFYPVLIRNRKKAFTATPNGLRGKRGRTAFATDTDGNIYLALVPDSGGATLSQVAAALIQAGASDGGNFDGGGSSQWYSPGGCIYTGRPLRGFIGIWIKNK